MKEKFEMLINSLKAGFVTVIIGIGLFVVAAGIVIIGILTPIINIIKPETICIDNGSIT